MVVARASWNTVECESEQAHNSVQTLKRSCFTAQNYTLLHRKHATKYKYKYTLYVSHKSYTFCSVLFDNCQFAWHWILNLNQLEMEHISMVFIIWQVFSAWESILTLKPHFKFGKHLNILNSGNTQKFNSFSCLLFGFTVQRKPNVQNYHQAALEAYSNWHFHRYMTSSIEMMNVELGQHTRACRKWFQTA